MQLRFGNSPFIGVKIEGETMISDFENLSTRDVALIVGSVDLLHMKQKIRAITRMETKKVMFKTLK